MSCLLHERALSCLAVAHANSSCPSLPAHLDCSMYVGYRILTEFPDRTIVLVADNDANGYIIPPHGPVRSFDPAKVSWHDLQRLRDLGDAPLFIADSLLPPALPFPTLVVSSPGHLASRTLTNKLNSYKLFWHYMPVPSEKELLDLRAAAFPHLDEEGVKTRMKVWGPIPRHVLVHPSPGDQKLFWNKAKAVSLDVLEGLLRGASQGDAAYRVVHERAEGQDAPIGSPQADPSSPLYYARGAIVPASPAMLRHITDRINKEHNWKAASFIDSAAGIGALGAVRGIKFEDLVINMLADGVTLKCRMLDASAAASPSTQAAASTAGNKQPNEAGRRTRQLCRALPRLPPILPPS